ncbi:C4-dicarboxylate transporter DcuC [Parasutterella secunda]|uniref:C4-dicarboxylate transporter DcuC n=1 Tax=Parasutterella secunda TaxID=626947 RepID=A0ABS2GSU3_9BURK|nr:C4-dicarboxylate transporter DcuC [Parasutterella secunda]MBM6928910.1 C4-dicarboxylate transporter DcuC [Parasutterella secunda]
MTLLNWVAVVVVILTIAALIKRYETRLVLFTAGLILCCVSMQPMTAFNAFAKSMTNGGLIMAICASMGFAYVSSYTKCDQHLVHLLSKPIRGLGIFLVPICTAVTMIINIAIPSASGCAAAVGSTLIPVMLRAGISPAAAAASVMMGTYGGVLSPGSAHNVYIAKISNMEIMDFIALHTPFSLVLYAIGIVGILVMCIIFKDKGEATDNIQVNVDSKQEEIERPNVIYAMVPLLPIVILVLGNSVLPAIKMGVAQAMVLGAVLCLLITRANPQQFSKTFFNGLGKGYGNILGIIIAAGVFAAGLRAAGLIDTFIALLREANDIARWGGSLGPWFLGTITGSGDAATFAFNEAVTPHAASFGMDIPHLGALAFLSGALGRTSSPIAGAMMVVAGIAMANPVEVAKRTIVPCFIGVIVLAFIIV